MSEFSLNPSRNLDMLRLLQPGKLRRNTSFIIHDPDREEVETHIEALKLTLKDKQEPLGRIKNNLHRNWLIN